LPRGRPLPGLPPDGLGAGERGADERAGALDAIGLDACRVEKGRSAKACCGFARPGALGFATLPVAGRAPSSSGLRFVN